MSDTKQMRYYKKNRERLNERTKELSKLDRKLARMVRNGEADSDIQDVLKLYKKYESR